MGLAQNGGGGEEIDRSKSFLAGWNVVPRPCDYCSSAAALLFCHVDSAFMCMSCDARVHNAGESKAAPVQHERVWMCDACEQAPAALTCKADAAALCVACDRDIHSANPLARRHERSPVVPFYDTAESVMMKSTAALFDYPRDDAFSSLSILTAKFPTETPEMKPMEFLFSDPDHFLDFDNYQFCSQPYSDSIVPAVQTAVEPPVSAQLTHQNSPEIQFEIDFSRSNITSYNTSSISHSVSSLSLDVGVVPDGSAVSGTSFSFSKAMSSSMDQSANQDSQVVRMDREARVLRYKEKRKNRKFQKTVRYASRKAYAETRPRIKGRFAKRTDSESEVDGIFSFVSGDLIADARYGVVPSF